MLSSMLIHETVSFKNRLYPRFLRAVIHRAVTPYMYCAGLSVARLPLIAAWGCAAKGGGDKKKTQKKARESK